MLVINRNFKNNCSELKCGGRFLAVSDKYLARMAISNLEIDYHLFQ